MSTVQWVALSLIAGLFYYLIWVIWNQAKRIRELEVKLGVDPSPPIIPLPKRGRDGRYYKDL
jgi:hypothetical protein